MLLGICGDCTCVPRRVWQSANVSVSQAVWDYQSVTLEIDLGPKPGEEAYELLTGVPRVLGSALDV